MAGKILVGTASWSDPGFVADWYPKSLPAGERLPFYAQFFNFVELNSSFYGIPSAKQVERWCMQTPKDFTFDVKLHKMLSRHAAGPESLTPDLRKLAALTPTGKVQLTPQMEEAVAKRFLDEIEPLRTSGKLGALLLQLSPSFSPRHHKLRDLENLLSILSPCPVAVEFRNTGWVTEKNLPLVQEFLQKHHATFVAVDAPDTPHFMSMPWVNLVTNPKLSYIRCHGRNAEGYIKGRTVAERFNYQYSEQELREIADKARQMAEESAETHVVYNNNASDYAIQSARRFQDIISEPAATAVG